jgi:hypothetical protein
LKGQFPRGSRVKADISGATLRDINAQISIETGERNDRYTHYYLEFDVDMPDELFNGEGVDWKNFWTEFK